jgi:hypothetical protein
MPRRGEVPSPAGEFAGNNPAFAEQFPHSTDSRTHACRPQAPLRNTIIAEVTQDAGASGSLQQGIFEHRV